MSTLSIGLNKFAFVENPESCEFKARLKNYDDISMIKCLKNLKVLFTKHPRVVHSRG